MRSRPRSRAARRVLAGRTWSERWTARLLRVRPSYVLILHREPRPVARARATGPARITSPYPERRVRSLWRHTVYRAPQLVGAVTLDQGSDLRRQAGLHRRFLLGGREVPSTRVSKRALLCISFRRALFKSLGLMANPNPSWPIRTPAWIITSLPTIA